MPVIISGRSLHASSLFLFFIFIGVYGLSYSGVPITDDEQLFASAAISLAQNNDLRAQQLTGNERLHGIYRGVGPLHPIIGALVLRLNPISSLGNVQLLFLLPSLYTALTGILLFRLVLILGYPLRLAVLGSLFFGLSTMAWPYSKAFFREPLAMLLLMVIWISFEIIISDKKDDLTKLLGITGFCLALAGLLLTKIQLAVVLPIFIWIGLRSSKPNIKALKRYRYLLAGWLVIFFISILLIKFILDHNLPFDINGRLSISFLEFAYMRLISIPHSSFWSAIVGAMFSTGKGFFWYSPVTILAIFSIFSLIRWHKREVYLPWLIFLSILIVQALAYDGNWWNITWSTRFLLPVLPMMVVAGLPFLEQLLYSDNRFFRLFPFILFSLGVLIQLSAVLISDITYLTRLYQKYGSVYPKPFLWGLGTIPPIGHLGMILDGINWDLVLWRVFNQRPAVVLIAGVTLLGTSMVGIIGLWHSLRGRSPKIRSITAIILVCLVLIIDSSLLLKTAQEDYRYYAIREDFTLTNAWISENAKPGDAILVDSYLEPLWYYFWNFGESESLIYSLPYQDSQIRSALEDYPKDSSNPNIYQTLIDQHERIWLVCENRCSSRETSQIQLAMSLIYKRELFFFDPRTGSQTDLILYDIQERDT